jgi:hypothetical protein
VSSLGVCHYFWSSLVLSEIPSVRILIVQPMDQYNLSIHCRLFTALAWCRHFPYIKIGTDNIDWRHVVSCCPSHLYCPLCNAVFCVAQSVTNLAEAAADPPLDGSQQFVEPAPGQAQWYIDEGVIWGFSWLKATGRRFGHKTQKGPAKFVYCVCVLCMVSFSPLWLKFVPGWSAVSVRSWQQYSLVHMIWFGWMSDISQLASRVGGGGGGWGGMGHWGPHIFTLPGSGRVVAFPPLVQASAS